MCTLELPQNSQKIAYWFCNFAKAQKQASQPPDATKDEGSESENAGPPGKNRYCKTYKPQDAVNVLYHDHVKAILEASSTGKTGSRQYMGLYPAALSEVLKTLTADELKAAEELAHKWNSDSMPPEQQKWFVTYQQIINKLHY